MKYDEKRYLSQFVSQMFDSLQYDSAECAPQYMSLTVWLPWHQTEFQTSPILKGISGKLWHSILVFANGASYV